MKLRLPLTLAAAIMACYSHVSFSADTGTGFSINFIRNDTFSMGSTDPIQNVGMPGVEIPSGFWNNISPGTANAWYSVERDNQGGALTGISVATTRTSFWSSGKTDTQTDKLLASYIDAGRADAYTVTIAGVPYLSSTVYIIMSGDNTQVEHNTAMNVNGVNWTFKDGEMVEGTDVWGSYANNQGALVLGTNVLEIKDITGGSIFISNVVNSAGRGCIAGIQVVDSYAGTYLYRTLGSTAAWTDALWSDTDGETGSLAWGGTNHAAVIKAEAGGSTLSVTGTVSADGIILKSGKLILSGGTLNMTGAAAFITEVGTTLKLDETSVTATGGLTFQGGGIFEVTNISKLPTLLKIDGGTLNSLNAVTVGEGGDMRVGGTAVFQAPSLTVESGGTISIHRSFSEALKVDSFSGSGELVLGTAISFDKDTLPGVHEFLKDFSGTLTLGGAGEYYFNYTGSTDFGSSILIGKEGMTIHVEKGATFRLNPINNGSNTFQNDMILEAGSSFYKQDASPLILSGNIRMNGNVTDSIIITGQWGAKSTLFSGKISGQGTVQLRLSGGLTETFRINNAANDFSGTWMVGRNDGGDNITLQLEADAISMASVELTDKGILRNNVESASLVNLSGTMANAQITSGAADGSFNTLTVKGIANYAGKIGKNLNLNLAGGVAHVLSGDLSAFTGTIAVADNAASNLTLSGSSSADGVNLSMSQGNLTTGVKVNLLSADSSALTLSLTAGGQIVVTGTASAFASTTVTGAGMIGMDLNSSAGTLDLGDFTIGATGGFLRINLSNTDDLSQFSLTATGTSLDVLRGSLTASAGNKLYVASGYAGNNVSFSEMNLLVNESESGADKYYYRNGDSVTLSQPEYSMNSLLINGDADEATTDEIILNGAALSADSLTLTSSAAYTIKNGETAGSLAVEQLSLLGSGTLTLNTASTIGQITGSGSLVLSQNTIIQSGTTTLASLNFNGTTLTLGDGSGKAEIIAGNRFNQTANTNLILQNGSSLTLNAFHLSNGATFNLGGDGENDWGVLNVQRYSGADEFQSGTTAFNIKTGNVMNILGAVDGTSGTGAFVLGHWNYTTSVNVSGVLNILNAHIGVVSATNATLNINEGGVVNIKGLDLAYKRDAAAKIAVVLNEGGMINMGEDGIGKTTGTADAFTLTLNGGTLGILNTVDSWTGVKAMTIGGSVTLNTDKYTPDTTAQGSDYDGYLGGVGTITISGGLTGVAGTANLTIAGGGEVVLSGANDDYQGGITIESGATLTATGDNNKTLGGDNAVVTLQDESKLVFGGTTMNADFAFKGNIVGNGKGTIESSTNVTLSDINVDVETVNITGGKLIWDNQTTSETNLLLGATVNIGPNSTLQLKFPGSTSKQNVVQSAVNLSEGGTLQLGTGYVAGGGAIVFNIEFAQGITIQPSSEAVVEKALLQLPSWERVYSVSKLNGSGNLEISRQAGVYTVDENKSLFIISGVDDDSSKWFTGTISLTNGDSGDNEVTKYFRLVLNHQNAAAKALISLDNAATKLRLGVADVTIAGLRSAKAGAMLEKSASLTSPSNLTINYSGSDALTFSGKVTDGVNVIKTGTGSQIFDGDLTAFNGTFTAKEGQLTVTGKTTVAGAEEGTTLPVVGSGTRFNLDGGKLSFPSLIAGSTLTTTLASNGSLTGALSLDGGSVVVLNDQVNTQYAVSDGGSITLGSGVVFDLSSLVSLTTGHYIYQMFTLAGGFDKSKISSYGMEVDEDSRDKIDYQLGAGNMLQVVFDKTDVTLTWTGDADLWQTRNDASSWTADIPSVDTSFHTGDKVVFTNDAAEKTVSIVGTVKPNTMEVTGGDYTFNAGTDGTIAGSSSLSLTGGSLTMNLANTGWNGAISVGSAKLVANTAGALGTGTLTLNNGSTLGFVSEGLDSLASINIADSATTTLLWSGDQGTLNNRFTLGSNSILKVDAGTTAAAGSLTQALGTGQTLQFKGDFTGATLAVTGSGLLELLDSAKAATSLTNGVSYQVGSNAVLALSGTGTYSSGNLTGSGIIELTTTGTTTLSSSGDNSFSGTLVLKNGNGTHLVLGDATPGSGTFNLSGRPDVQMEAGSSMVLNSQFSSTDMAVAKTNALTIGNLSGTGTIRGDWNTSDGGNGHRFISVTQTDDLEFSGTIISSGSIVTNVGLLKNGSGTLTLSGANTSQADLDINAGGIILSGAGVWKGAINLTAAGSTLTYANTSDITQGTAVTAAAGSSINFTGGQTYTLSNESNAIAGSVSVGKAGDATGTKLVLSGGFGAGSISLATDQDALELSGADKELSGELSGNGSLSVTGGTQTLSYANSAFIGAVSVSGGTLRAGSNTALGNSDIDVSGTGALDVNGKTLANKVVLTGGSLAGGNASSIGDLSVNVAGAASASVKTTSLTGALSVDNLSLSSYNTFAASDNLIVRSTMTLGRGARATVAGNLALGGSLRLDSLITSPSTASLAITGTLTSTASSGNLTIDVSRTYLSQLTTGNYTLATYATQGSLTPEQILAGNAYADDSSVMNWNDVSNVYSFKLDTASSGGMTTLALVAFVDTDKAWVWDGASVATWDPSASNWIPVSGDTSGTNTGKVVYFGSPSIGETDRTVNVDGEGVAPIFMMVDTNTTYTFTGDGSIATDELAMTGIGTTVLENAKADGASNAIKRISLQKGTVKVTSDAAMGTPESISFEGGVLEYGTSGLADVSAAMSVKDGSGLNLAVSEGASATVGKLSADLASDTSLVLNKYGAGELVLDQDFAGTANVTGLYDLADTVNVARDDNDAGTLTLTDGHTYGAVNVGSAHTLRIADDAEVTVNSMIGGIADETGSTGYGTVSIGSGAVLAIGTAGTLSTALELGNGSGLVLADGGEGSPNTLAGAITLSTEGDGQARVTGGGTVLLAGTIASSDIAGNTSALTLENASFDASGASFADTVNLTLGTADASGTATLFDLGSDASKAIALAGLNVLSDAAVKGIAGQTLSFGSGSLAGTLDGDFTVRLTGGADGAGSVSLDVTDTADLGGVLFSVAGGTFGLNGLAGTNSIAISGGSLTGASNWTGRVSADTTSQYGDIDLGGLTASSLKEATLASGYVVNGIGQGAVSLDTADIGLGVANTIFRHGSTGATEGAGATVLNFGEGTPDANSVTMAGDSVMVLRSDDELSQYFLDKLAIMYGKDELLPDYAEPEEASNTISLTLTNGALNLTAGQIKFDPLLRTWGLKLESVDSASGSIVVSGNLSVWQASKEGNITGYDDLVDYRAVYVNRDMSITLPGSDSEPLTVKYLSGQKGTTLAIDSDGTGTARVRFYNDRDKDGELVDSVLAGNLTAGEHTALSKTGEATLTIGGTATLGGSLTVEEGGIALTRVGAAHSIASLTVGDGDAQAATFTLSGQGASAAVGTLAVGRDGTLALTGSKSVLEAGTLDEASGSILLGGDSTLKLASGAAIAGTVKALGGAAGSGTLELGAGTTTLTAAGALDGIALVTGESTRLILDTPDTSATLTAWNGLGTLAGEGNLTLTGKASYAGTLADFGGTLAASGRDASLTLAGTGSKAAALAASGGGSLTLDYTSGDATYSGLTLTGGSTATLIAGNGDGTNNTLTLRRGGTVSGDSTLGFILNTEASGSLSSTSPLVTTGGRETLDIAEGATVRLAAGDGQEVIHGTMPLQIALASKVSQQGGINLVFDELFGKYFDPSQSRVETVEGTMILTTAANRNGFYVHQAQSETARSGGALMDNALVTVNPQTTDRDSTLAALLNAVDASIKAHDRAGASRTMAAAAGSTVTSLLGSLQADYRYQQTLVRNRMTTMGLPDGYSYEGDLPLWNTWLQATGTYNRLNTDGDEAGYQYNTWGGTFGVDANLSSKFTAGLAMTASYGKLTSTAADSLSGDMEVYYVNLFGRYQSGKWGHNVILTAGWSQSDIDRTVPCGSGSYTGHGTPGGQVWGAMYEGTYDISLNEENSAILQPLVNVSILKSSVDDYTEEGAGSAGLRAGGMDATTGTVSAGVRWMGLTGGNLFGRESLAEVRAQVSQDFGDTRNEAQVGFVGVPGFSRGVKGSKAGTTGLQFGAGLSIPTGDQGTIFVEANADLRSRMTSANGSIGYRYNF
ncbi:hypothetical protein QET93_002315 [Akkermansia sp. N21116]|uniref:hypothetical protein n=1 Tax=Akkermansia sp. N21116 TaxID=3040764 RepID=UPI002AC91ADC|nr:hypothetical protein [Akkermansia sp. N21116]WPX40938.1 hypothetical protein QET93_002315 [Akkermansia sp. N21116]